MQQQQRAEGCERDEELECMPNMTRCMPVISDIRVSGSCWSVKQPRLHRFCNGTEAAMRQSIPSLGNSLLKLYCREMTIIAAFAILKTKRKLAALGLSTLMQFSLLKTPVGFVAQYQILFCCLSCRTRAELLTKTSKTIDDCCGYLIVSCHPPTPPPHPAPRDWNGSRITWREFR